MTILIISPLKLPIRQLMIGHNRIFCRHTASGMKSICADILIVLPGTPETLRSLARERLAGSLIRKIFELKEVGA